MQETDENEFNCSRSIGAMERRVQLRTSLTSASPSRFECHSCGKSFPTERIRERHQLHTRRSNGPFIRSLPTDIRGMRGSAVLFPRFKKWDCPHPTCKRRGKGGFRRRDNLIHHCRNVHNQYIRYQSRVNCKH